jgi:hypothetical protein
MASYCGKCENVSWLFSAHRPIISWFCINEGVALAAHSAPESRLQTELISTRLGDNPRFRVATLPTSIALGISGMQLCLRLF